MVRTGRVSVPGDLGFLFRLPTLHHFSYRPEKDGSDGHEDRGKDAQE